VSGGDLAWPVSPDVVSAVFSGRPFSTDRAYEQIWRTLNAQIPVRVTAVRFRGIDTAGHYYLRYAGRGSSGTCPRTRRTGTAAS